MRMIPSRVVRAHAEWILPPTKYRLSKTLAGSAYQVLRAGALAGFATYAGTTSLASSPPLWGRRQTLTSVPRNSKPAAVFADCTAAWASASKSLLAGDCASALQTANPPATANAAREKRASCFLISLSIPHHLSARLREISTRQFGSGALDCRTIPTIQPLPREPLLDEACDLQVVPVHHQHMRIAAQPRVRQVEDLDLAARLRNLADELDPVLPDLRPARVERDIIAVDDERRDVLENGRLLRVAHPRRLHRDERLDFVGPRLRHLEAELPRLRVKENHAGAHAIHQRRIRADNRLVGRRPARHVLLHETVVGLDRELAGRHQLLLRRIGAVGSRALPDAEALEGIRLGEEHRLALENIRIHRPARAPALHRVRVVHVPALLHEEIQPALAPVGRRLVRHARQAAAVPHQERHRSAAVRRKKILHVHRLDRIRAVEIDLRRNAARREHHLLHGLPRDLHISPADVERAHVAESAGSGGAGGEERGDRQNGSLAHDGFLSLLGVQCSSGSEGLGVTVAWARRCQEG